MKSGAVGRGDRLGAVVAFAERVLREGRDRYGHARGGVDTPLFADGVHPRSGEHVRWRPEQGEPFPASNLANQQNLLRTLVALSLVSGDEQYVEAAEAAVRYHFDALQDPGGLLQWGGHRLINLETLRPGGNKGLVHELKDVLPFYEFMFAVDSWATRRFVEGFWNAHVLEWSTLEISRHGEYGLEAGPLWEHSFADPEPFRKVVGLSFLSAGNDLIYSAGMLHLATGEEGPLRWMKRLAGMYVKARHPRTGLGAYQYTQPLKRREPESDRDTHSACGDRALRQLGPEFGPEAIEGNVLLAPQARSIYGVNALMQLALAERLGVNGRELVEWTAAGLAAYARHAYVPERNQFKPLLANGTDLSGHVLPRDGYYGRAGRVLEPFAADGLFLAAYARAYRLTGDEAIWQVVRQIARGLGLGELGDGPGRGSRPHPSVACRDPRAIFALLELYDVGRCPVYLELAERVGENLLATSFAEGYFSGGGETVLFDSLEPWALLALEAARRPGAGEFPRYAGGAASRHAGAYYVV